MKRLVSFLNEIVSLRNGRNIVIDHQNSNRYRLLVTEPNGTKTAYCFSTPIYNRKTKRLVDLRFHTDGEVAYFSGSNAEIAVTDSIHLENTEGYCIIRTDRKFFPDSGREIRCDRNTVFPTTNGIALKEYIGNTGKMSLEIETGQSFFQVLANDKYFALMQDRFQPFVTLSGIGVLDKNDQLTAPVTVAYKKLSDCRYKYPCPLQVRLVSIYCLK